MHSMNTENLSGTKLQNALTAQLEELLQSVEWLRGWKVKSVGGAADAGFDLLATLPLPGGGMAALCVVCKSELRPSTFKLLIDKALSPPGRPVVVVRVLASSWVSPRVAELCAQHGWNWFDLAGNHRLDIPGLLHLQHTGNAAVHSPVRPMANLGTRESARVLRALLAPENTGRHWTQREIRAHCQPEVSLGLVNKVVRHLRDEAFIESAPEGGFRVSEPVKLLIEWRDAYRFDRHEQREYFTLLQGKNLRDALADFGAQSNSSRQSDSNTGCGGLAAYAAFSAAEFQAPHVRQAKTWLYVREQGISNFEKFVEAKRVDSGENLTVLIPEDDGVFYLGEGGTRGDHRLVCTNAVQTYVDLYHCGGRGQEAADALLNHRLKPAWKRGGLEL
jgi:hypothetical protein